MVNAWVEHVRKVAKELGISYMCAVEKAKESYKPPEKQKPEGKRALKEKKEQEKIKLLQTQPENMDILNDLIEKIKKRENARESRESKKIHKAYMKSEGFVVDNPLEKYTIEQLEERIELMKKEPERFTPFPDLINDEIKPVLDEIHRKKKLKQQQQKQKEKKEKEKKKTEKK